MGKIIRNGVEFSGTLDNAANVNYNNELSGMEATTVQEAIDEVNESLDSLLLYKESAQISISANSTNTVNVTFPSGYKAVSVFSNNTYTVAAYNTISSTEVKITIRNYHDESVNTKAFVLLAKI